MPDDPHHQVETHPFPAAERSNLPHVGHVASGYVDAVSVYNGLHRNCVRVEGLLHRCLHCGDARAEVNELWHMRPSFWRLVYEPVESFRARLSASAAREGGAAAQAAAARGR